MVMMLQIFTCYLMFMNTLKFEVLGLRFSRLGHERQTFQYAELNDNWTKSLIKCIECHRRIVGNIRRIERNLSGIFLLQISCSSIVICSGAYILAFSPPQDNQFQIIVRIALIGYYIFDIFLTMYFGNLIIVKSENKRSSLYESNWTQQSLKFRRIAMIMFERLREPTVIRVGKLFPLSLETFSAILATAYRLFSVFANMDEIPM